MIKVPHIKICNDIGEEILLNKREQAHANYIQEIVNKRFENDLGYEVNITTLTTIMKKVTGQKFFEVAPADFMPVKVGEGAWSSNLTAFRDFSMGGSFDEGIMNLGSNSSKMGNADTAVDSLNIKVLNWAKSIGWSIFDLEFAAKSGNWDLVVAKEKSRKKNWDLGIQKVAFLGLKGSKNQCLGLLNQPGIEVDSTTIPKAIKSMTPAELKTFVGKIIEAYRANCQRTAYPTHFIMPESDYNGLAAQSSPDFPIKSVLEVLTDAFKILTKNPNFKILSLSYGDVAYSEGILTKPRYVLLNYEEESLVMNIPVDYTNTLANSLDNFNFQNAAYGQFTGVLTLRPQEMMYFEY